MNKIFLITLILLLTSLSSHGGEIRETKVGINVSEVMVAVDKVITLSKSKDAQVRQVTLMWEKRVSVVL